MTRIVLADDAILLREALAAGLLKPPASRSWDRPGTSPASWWLVEKGRPDVVVVDVRMPPTHTTEGLEAAREIRRLHPGMAILVLSQYVETRYAVDLIREDPAGIGYLLKDRVTRLETWPTPSGASSSGGSVIDPEVVARLLGRPRRHSPLDELTPREREILALMAEGRSNQGIARPPRARAQDGRRPRPSGLLRSWTWSPPIRGPSPCAGGPDLPARDRDMNE